MQKRTYKYTSILVASLQCTYANDIATWSVVSSVLSTTVVLISAVTGGTGTGFFSGANWLCRCNLRSFKSLKSEASLPIDWKSRHTTCKLSVSTIHHDNLVYNYRLCVTPMAFISLYYTRGLCMYSGDRLQLYRKNTLNLESGTYGLKDYISWCWQCQSKISHHQSSHTIPSNC